MESLIVNSIEEGPWQEDLLDCERVQPRDFPCIGIHARDGRRCRDVRERDKQADRTYEQHVGRGTMPYPLVGLVSLHGTECLCPDKACRSPIGWDLDSGRAQIPRLHILTKFVETGRT